MGELSKVCSQIVLKCLFLARIGRPDILWSVNKIARSITKWTKASDKRLSRLISCIHHTSEYKQYCHVGNTAKQCRLGLFQDSDFAGDLEDSKSTSGGTLCIFGSHTFVPISWMCKFYIECDGTYWDEDDGEQLEPSQVKAGIEREVKQMRELDVAEERSRDEVPEGVRIWSGRWCHRKKAGGVRSRYVVRQYHTEWSEDAFCGTPGWGAIRPLLAVASLMRWKVMPGDFSTAFMHTPLLDSDEYWIEPPREVVPDTRIVWKLKKALNGLVTASKRFQQHLFRLLHDLGFECCPLLPTLLRNPITGTIMVVLVDDPMASGPPGDAEKLFEALGKHIATRPGATVALHGYICLPGHEALEHQVWVRGDAEGRVYRGHPYHCGTGRIACSRWKRCSDTWDQGQAKDQGR